MDRLQWTSRRLSRFAVALAVIGFITAAASTALAGDAEDATDLLEYLPEDSRTIGVADFQKLRKSNYFEEALKVAEQKAGKDDLGKLLQQKAGLDLKTDLHKMAIGMPSTQFKGGDGPDKIVFVMTGDFDREKIASLLEKEADHLKKREIAGKYEGYANDDTELVLADDHHLFVVQGDESYRAKAWKVIKGKGTSFTKTAKSRNLLAHLDTDRAFWVLSRPPASASQAQGIESAGLAVNVDSGIDIQLVSHAESSEKAAEMTKQLENAKSQGAQNPMVSMFGASPLLTNLKVQQKDKALIATTSMTDQELDAMVGAVKQFISTQKQQGGGGALPIPDKSGKSDGASEKSGEEDDEAKDKDGADADFN